MKTIWDRMHVWLKANAPQVYESLRPGASEEAIRAAERAMHLKFPEDLVAAYLVHDGQSTQFDGSFRPFLFGCEWLRLERIVEEWKIGKQLYEQDNRYPFWRPHWIPLSFDGTQLVHYDTETDQVIDAWESDFAITTFFAPSLEMLLDDLDNGHHHWCGDALVNPEDVLRERFL